MLRTEPSGTLLKKSRAYDFSCEPVDFGRFLDYPMYIIAGVSISLMIRKSVSNYNR